MSKTFTMTNADRVRAMSDEELAKLLVNVIFSKWDFRWEWCEKTCTNDDSCEDCILTWLKKEVEDGREA